MHTKRRRDEELTESRRGQVAIKFHDTKNNAARSLAVRSADDHHSDIGEF
ncbi:MAG: hypothetical protein WB723_10610 [Candidatus Acidiferrales bacterium]